MIKVANIPSFDVNNVWMFQAKPGEVVNEVIHFSRGYYPPEYSVVTYVESGLFASESTEESLAVACKRQLHLFPWPSRFLAGLLDKGLRLQEEKNNLVPPVSELLTESNHNHPFTIYFRSHAVSLSVIGGPSVESYQGGSNLRSADLGLPWLQEVEVGLFITTIVGFLPGKSIRAESLLAPILKKQHEDLVARITPSLFAPMSTIKGKING